jgi:HlyD family type I secretion membrane fusion protein
VTRADPPFPTGTTLFGLTIVAAFVLAFGAWSRMAPIESAVIAPGVVAAATGLREVEHLEGGIVTEIEVAAGDRVERGQVLLRLDATGPRARRGELQAGLYEALATQARLAAERDGAPSITFPDGLAGRRADLAAQDAMASQRAIFDTRRRLHAERLDILARTRDGLAAEIEGMRGQIAAADRRLAILDEELATARALLDRDLARRSDVLRLERERAELQGAVAETRAAIGAAEQRAAEARLRVAELRALRATGIAEDLRAATARVHELEQRIDAAENVLRRTEIRAPVAGIVVDMAVGTVGGVVEAGEMLLSILPEGDAFVVRASIDPLDIDRVAPGLDATVWLSSLNRRRQSGIAGRVETISADRLTDPATGAPYYLARVAMEAGGAERSGVPLHAGMGAEVLIATGRQTALDYLAAPIARSLSRAFREE